MAMLSYSTLRRVPQSDPVMGIVGAGILPTLKCSSYELAAPNTDKIKQETFNIVAYYSVRT